MDGLKPGRCSFDGPAYVYMIRAGNTPWYKIGLAKDVQNRKHTMQVGCPHRLISIAKAECCCTACASRLEAALHEAYKNMKRRGEWFELQEWHVSLFVDIAAEVTEHTHTTYLSIVQSYVDKANGGEYGR